MNFITYNEIRLEGGCGLVSFSTLSFRQIIIMNTLLENGDWTSLKELSMITNVSERTIRNDLEWLIGEFAKYDCGIETLRGKGFRIDKENKTKIQSIISNTESASASLHSRTHNILISLLTRKEYVSIDDLCEIYYVSNTTMEKEIKNINNILQSFGGEVTLDRKAGKIMIIGNEKYRRLLIGEILMSYDKVNKFESDMYLFYFDKTDFEYVKKIIIDCLSKNNLNLPDIGILSLTLHVMIALNRIREGYTLCEEDIVKPNQLGGEGIESTISQEICKILSIKYNVEISQTEQQAISYQITLKKIIPTDGLSKDEVILHTDEKYSLIVSELLSDIKQEFLLDLTNDDELFIGLIYHIKTLIQRLQYRSNYFNPVLDYIKEDYPFVFELAIFVRTRLEELIGITLDENEVSFFAIHLGTAFQRQRQLDTKERIKIAVICHTGYSNAKFLVTKLKSIYFDKVSIVGTFSSFNLDHINRSNIDILVTTTDVEVDNDNIQVVKVHPLLRKGNIQLLDKLIDKMSTNSDDMFLHFFNREFFYEDLVVSDYMELINFMSNQLQESNYVYSSFTESCIQREDLSTTVVKNGIALPHPLKPLAFKSCISIAILKRPIVWKEKPIRIAFMFAICRNDQQHIKSFLEFVVDLMDNETLIDEMVNAKSYDKFIELVKQYH